MKRFLSCVLTIVLVLVSVSAFAREAAGQDRTTSLFAFEPVEDTIGLQPGTNITVASTTAMNGVFATDLFGNNTSDMDVRALIHGYATVAWTVTLGMSLDPTVVANVETATSRNGRVYTFTLMPGLLYNDGTPITAKDYVFSLLLSCAPQIGEIGGDPRGLAHLIGYEPYISGQNTAFSGVRLISDTSFSMEISNDFLPFFYGLAMLNVQPYPISVIAPGCDVFDNGNGAYIGMANNAAAFNANLGYTPGVFTADMLRVTMLDPDNGYVYNPRVSCGPYSFLSFDKETRRATFIANANYVGNYEMQRPHIERITFEHVTNEEMIGKLQSGEIDILNKVGLNTSVQAGLALQQSREAQAANYPRTGFVYLAFACEEGVTSSAAVRKAVSYCLNKTEVTNLIVGGQNLGLPVYGYYGMGQWMVSERFTADAATGAGELDVQAELAKLEIPMDLEMAKQILKDDGWNLNEKGEAYVEGTDKLRYRNEDGSLVPLIIRWGKTADSSIADILESKLTEPLMAVGIELQVTEIPFGEVLERHYRQIERGYDMLYLASNFVYVFDPFYDYHTDDMYQGLVNSSGLKDAELMELALDMRKTPTNEIRQYVEKWLRFQQRWVEVMPMVPLYSNIYFDFYANDIQDYDVAAYPGWSIAIPYAYVGEPTP